MSSRTPATATPGTFPSSSLYPNMRPASAAPPDVVHPYFVTPQQHHQYLANLAASQMAAKRDLGKDFNVGAGYSGNVLTHRVYKLTATP